jgi:hypothetical protein
MIKPVERIYGPCCGVFAVFLAAPDDDFQNLFEESREKLGRAKVWKGRMYFRELLNLLNSVNVRYTEVPSAKYLTIGKACKESIFGDGAQYIVSISGHFLTIRSGLCYDQSNPVGTPFDQYRHRRCKIVRAVRIS